MQSGLCHLEQQIPNDDKMCKLSQVIMTSNQSLHLILFMKVIVDLDLFFTVIFCLKEKGLVPYVNLSFLFDSTTTDYSRQL